MMRMRLAALALLLASASAWAVFPPDVKDEGKFFKPDALKGANKKIREVFEKYKKDVVVEAYSALPPAMRKILTEAKGDNEAAFAKMAAARSKELGVDGVYILICKSPRVLRVHTSPEVEKKAFPADQQKELREKMLARFKADDFDGGLLAALDHVAATLEKTNK